MTDNIRKNLSIDSEADKCIQSTRSKLLGKDVPVDIEYSAANSMLTELGDLLYSEIENLPDPAREEDNRIGLSLDQEKLIKLSEVKPRAMAIVHKYTGL